MKDEQIICLCQNVNVGKIRQAIADGVTTFEEMKHVTNCAKSCGMCMNAVKECMEAICRENRVTKQ